MSIDTGAFIAGVSVLVALDLFNLGVTVVNARRTGVDEVARDRAATAQEQADKNRQTIEQAVRNPHVRDDD